MGTVFSVEPTSASERRWPDPLLGDHHASSVSKLLINRCSRQTSAAPNPVLARYGDSFFSACYAVTSTECPSVDVGIGVTQKKRKKKEKRQLPTWFKLYRY